MEWRTCWLAGLDKPVFEVFSRYCKGGQEERTDGTVLNGIKWNRMDCDKMIGTVRNKKRDTVPRYLCTVLLGFRSGITGSGLSM
jgi:hypothetical protein